MPVIGNLTFGSTIPSHAELNGRSVISDGLGPMMKYNPATGALLPLVLRPFRGSVALTLNGVGLLNGDYVYRVVPYNQAEDEEGEPFPGEADVAAFAITAVNNKVRINRAALLRDDAEATHWRIYRTVDMGVWPVMFRVATVLWATAIYDDNTADPDQDSDVFVDEAFDYLVAVPTPKPFLCQHGDRIFAIGDIPYDAGHAHVTNGSKNVQPVGGAVWGFWLEGKEFHAGTDPQSYVIDHWDPTGNQLVLKTNYAGGTNVSIDYRICGDASEMIWCEPDRENQWPGANNRSVGGKEADKPVGILSDAGRIIVPKSRKIYEVVTSGEFWQYPYSRVSLISCQHGGISHRSTGYINQVPTIASKHGLIQVGGGNAVLVSAVLGEWFKDNLALDADGSLQMCFAVHLAEKFQYMLFVKSKDALVGCDKAVIWQYDSRKFTIFEFLTEFTCGAVVKNASGEDIVALGDVNGYVWEYPFGDIDGAPAGSTLSGNVDAYGAASPCAIIDLDAQFPISDLGLAGVPVYIYEGTGAGQTAVILGNSVDTLFLDRCFPVALDSTSRYYIGPILFQYRTGWMDFGSIARVKNLKFARLVFKQEASRLRLSVYKDFEAVVAPDLVDERTAEDFGDVDLNQPKGRVRVQLGGIEGVHLAWEVSDDRPANPITLYDLGLDAEMKEK
jgi:hypothetical protein